MTTTDRCREQKSNERFVCFMGLNVTFGGEYQSALCASVCVYPNENTYVMSQRTINTAAYVRVCVCVGELGLLLR